MIRRSSGELVASHLRRMVFEGAYRPGDRVRQDEIAAELGVSRIPVREAIIALDREGWVTVEPHRGAFVRGIDADYVRDHYELYGLVFGLMASRVAERADDAGLARVLGAAKQVADASRSDATDFNAANRDFLRTLEDVAAAPRLTSMARVMTSIVPGNFFREIPGALDVQRKGIAAVARALKARDGERASREFRALLRRQGEAVVQLLARRDIFGPAPEASSAPS
jgi:DNA-binding GntR family transcriptional regulator